jgi:eukaryotic-like serine/threonine-protein kinase
MNTIGHANTFPSAPPLTAVNGGAVARPVIAGCEIFECLGRGGCASVYEARHPVHGEVAIKISEAPRASAVDAEQRLEREALLMQRVAHENVLRVFDIGYTADGAPYLVMERLRGEDLETLLERVGRLPISVACELAVQTLGGLEAVHAAGIVHRDLKPNNIVLHAPDEWGAPIVKLIDFGIARGDDAAKLTRTGMVIGTPQYLSPEQAQGKPVDARADVWASGILLFELIVGEGPFEGTSLQETLASILFADVPSIRERRPDVPDAIADVIDRALERDLTRRFASAKEMREALALAVAKSSVPSGAQTLFAVSVLPKKTLSPWKSMLDGEPSGVRARPVAEAKTVPLAATTKRRRGLVLLAVAVLALLAGG